MKKNLAFILLSLCFFLSCKSKSVNYSHKNHETVENDSIIKTVEIPDEYYDISIIYYKNNRIKYSKKYQNYWNLTYDYFIKNDSIILMNSSGKEGVIRQSSPGDENKNYKIYSLYEEHYDFTKKNNGMVLQKKLPFYRYDNVEQKLKQFREMSLEKINVTDEEYSTLYKKFKKLIK